NIPCMGLNYDLIIAPDTRSFKLKRWPEGQGINPPKYWKLKFMTVHNSGLEPPNLPISIWML
ncbi:hypothetical protein KKA94_00145, partial [Patescibacteria group bacterium]|nr:hypothetical protein [Patescibacteria group bacterium]